MKQQQQLAYQQQQMAYEQQRQQQLAYQQQMQQQKQKQYPPQPSLPTAAANIIALNREPVSEHSSRQRSAAYIQNYLENSGSHHHPTVGGETRDANAMFATFAGEHGSYDSYKAFERPENHPYYSTPSNHPQAPYAREQIAAYENAQWDRIYQETSSKGADFARNLSPEQRAKYMATIGHVAETARSMTRHAPTQMNPAGLSTTPPKDTKHTYTHSASSSSKTHGKGR
ncbi:hypothetical protein [Streptomyces thermoviolaceus]|uniref:Uncharacterized protein n=1 Tax=Streptomyces thermoviolaceus subsp. thermoviolaceus TaxID=66860 RepID=A0ABX0YVB6_STRTL|nr:hypothetical protein [Streptomyces thermoviolaceus]NJP15060.1 hypothetical protein [Streptomyces thermoviolaceus subsp. thermoviolaceus]WTD47928.1 hypothetical protein OG899_10545 [Streptomyces thermoviolaceus]